MKRVIIQKDKEETILAEDSSSMRFYLVIASNMVGLIRFTNHKGGSITSGGDGDWQWNVLPLHNFTAGKNEWVLSNASLQNYLDYLIKNELTVYEFDYFEDLAKHVSLKSFN